MTASIRRGVRWLGLIASFMLASGRAAEAQTPLNVVPGTRVRVTAANQVAPLVANFMAVRGDTAMFIEDGPGRGIWSILVEDIRKIEKSDGERLTNRRYMLRGAVIGGSVGLMGGLVFANNAKPSDTDRQYNKWGTASVLTVLGAAIGAGIGSRWAVERWTEVPLRRVSLGPLVGPSGGRGIRASVSIAF